MAPAASERDALFKQVFAGLKLPKVTIAQMVSEAVAKLGENISVARFVRLKVGEGA